MTAVGPTDVPTRAGTKVSERSRRWWYAMSTRTRRRLVTLGKLLLVVSVAGGGIWTAMHGIAGANWVDILQVLRGVSVLHLLMLGAIWFGGLAIYSLVLAAALPGLGVRRSLILNLSGSAVANVVPLGGAVATALNWRMVRTWGHSNAAFVAFYVLTNALDVLAKLLLPVAAVALLVSLSTHVPMLLWLVTAGCLALILLAVVGHAFWRRPASARATASRWRALVRDYLQDSGERIRVLLAGNWATLLPASVAYVAAQVLLLWVALVSVGLSPSVEVLVTAAAIERLGTIIPVTPAGAGIAELGTIGWLVAAGLDPVEAVAGVLLYRVFLVVAEIPVGGLVLGGWAWRQRRSALRDQAADGGMTKAAA
ncbi:MAG TPA: YbhN family protein [Marmoricola sp.]|nr:YbhN family protein [Marmoricola sp.]